MLRPNLLIYNLKCFQVKALNRLIMIVSISQAILLSDFSQRLNDLYRFWEVFHVRQLSKHCADNSWFNVLQLALLASWCQTSFFLFHCEASENKYHQGCNKFYQSSALIMLAFRLHRANLQCFLLQKNATSNCSTWLEVLLKLISIINHVYKEAWQNMIENMFPFSEYVLRNVQNDCVQLLFTCP